VKKSGRVLLIGVFLLAIWPSSGACAGEGSFAEKVQESFIRVVKEIGPAVVSIVAQGGEGGDVAKDLYRIPPWLSGKPFGERPALGSGVIIDKDGLVLTSAHVIEAAGEVEVILSDGRTLPAKERASDAITDLAVLQMEAKDLPVAKLFQGERVNIGEWAIALGNPFGLGKGGPTMTIGVVSAVGRELSPRYPGNLIQTDADINPGNSGGPLLNIRGEVIGINTAIIGTFSGSKGFGFAVPMNSRTRRIIAKLCRGEPVEHGWLGVEMMPVTAEVSLKLGIGQRQGVLVKRVLRGSPAEKAGLSAGDFITRFDGRSISSDLELWRVVNETEVGRVAEVAFVRDGKERTVKVRIASRPQMAGEIGESKISWRGITVGELTRQKAESLGRTEGEGVLVLESSEDSPCYEAGIRKGTVILKVENQDVRSVEDFRRITRGLKGTALLITSEGLVLVKEEAVKK